MGKGRCKPDKQAKVCKVDATRRRVETSPLDRDVGDGDPCEVLEDNTQGIPSRNSTLNGMALAKYAFKCNNDAVCWSKCILQSYSMSNVYLTGEAKFAIEDERSMHAKHIVLRKKIEKCTRKRVRTSGTHYDDCLLVRGRGGVKV